MIERDPFEILKRINPIRHARPDPADDALLVRILATPAPAPTPMKNRPKRRTIAIVGGIGVVVLATAAFAFLSTGSAKDPTEIGCHRTADVSSDREVRPNVGNPVAACATPWTNGLFGTDGPPEMHACVGSGNAIEVFPGDVDVCARLGLAREDTGAGATAAQIDQLTTRLSATFTTTCVGQQEALADTNQAISDVGLTGWTVQIGAPYTTGRPCTAFIADPTTKTVTIGGRLDITS